MSESTPLFVVCARYRGDATSRAELVSKVADAFGSQPGVISSRLAAVEDLVVGCSDAESCMRVVMAFLADGDWALAVALPGSGLDLYHAAHSSVGTRAGDVNIASGRAVDQKELAGDIKAAWKLIAYVLNRRTSEGREATALMRRGLNQSEVAEELGVSKQAVSQRLAAAGWSAEQAGWTLAVHLLQRCAQEQ